MLAAGGHIGRGDPGALERDHVGDAVEHVRLHAAGAGFREDFRRGRAFVGARELQLDAGIFLLEGLLQRPDRLIDDQGRVPDDAASPSWRPRSRPGPRPAPGARSRAPARERAGSGAGGSRRPPGNSRDPSLAPSLARGLAELMMRQEHSIRSRKTMRLGLFMMPLHPPVRPLGAHLAETDREGAAGGAARLRRGLGGRAFLRHHRADPLAADVHGEPHSADETHRVRHRRHQPAEPPSRRDRRGGRAVRPHERRPLPVRRRHRQPAVGLRAVRRRDADKRHRMLLESIDFIERIWSQGPPYEFNGEFWNFGIKKAISEKLGIGFMPKPLRQPGPPICVAISSPNSPTAEIAGRRGWGPVSSGLAPASAVATHWELYRKGALAAGRAGDGEDWRVVKYVLVAGSDAEARERVFMRDERLSLRLRLSLRGAQAGGPARRPQAASRHGRRRRDGRCHHRGARDLRLAADGGGEADRVSQRSRAVRPPVRYRRGLGRPERGLGARIDGAVWRKT